MAAELEWQITRDTELAKPIELFEELIAKHCGAMTG
jgi:hypothetical protein